MNRRSLTFRLISWYCGLLLGLGGGFAAFTLASFDHYAEQETRTTLAARTEAIWNMAQGLLDNPSKLTDLIERRFAPELQNRLIRISSGGKVYYQSGAPFEHGFDPAAVPLPAPNETAPHLLRLDNLSLFVTGFKTASGRTVIVECGRSTDLMDTAGRHLGTSLIFGLPILLILAAVGGYVLVQRALAPVQGMIEAAEAFSFNSPGNRLPLAGSEDRIEALGRALNRMLERLDNSYQLARRFTADAAHELRTPLAIMRGELELLISAPELSADAQSSIANILEETARLSQIVDSLIAMSRLDSVAGKRAHRAIDLHALAGETIDQLHLMAVDKDIAIKLLPGPRAMAAGDRDRLKQVLVNLLDNAIKYTPRGGHIEVAALESGDSAILTVSDSGIGIAPEHLPLVFDRFFRASTDRGEVGAGLGLAIVRAICAAHGGQVTVESQLGIGSRFKVELPRATEALLSKSERSDTVDDKAA